MSKEIDVNVRFYEPGDDEGIVELLRKTFPKWAEFKDPIGLWRWKYIDNPLISIISVAEADDKIVGCNPSLIFKAKLGSEITTLGYFDDLAVNSDYRGMGIYNKMHALKEDKFVSQAKYIFSTTVNPIVVESWKKRNRKIFPFPVTRMVKTNDIEQLLQERTTKNKPLVKLGYRIFKNLNKASNLVNSPIKPIDEFQIIQITEFDERIDSFWNLVKDDYNFIIENKHHYLNWRFTDNDRGTHTIFQAVNKEKVLGYIVVGNKPGSSEGQVLDLLALRERFDIVDALFGVACNYLDCVGVKTVFYQVTLNHPYKVLSERRGFIDSRSRPYISFDNSINWLGKAQTEISFLKHTSPSQVYFNYSTTL